MDAVCGLMQPALQTLSQRRHLEQRSSFKDNRKMDTCDSSPKKAPTGQIVLQYRRPYFTDRYKIVSRKNAAIAISGRGIEAVCIGFKKIFKGFSKSIPRLYDQANRGCKKWENILPVSEYGSNRLTSHKIPANKVTTVNARTV